MAESVIVDAQGRPIHKTELLQELVQASTTGVYQAWTVESVSATLDPARLRSILNAAAQGDHYSYLTLAEEMEEKDPHYAAVLGTRKRAVVSLHSHKPRMPSYPGCFSIRQWSR